ncbi:GNAT family N-acetyltransferase [Streptomyces sp. H39-S7]|uniref:GNAT family N-acetyltransferase n=1 Tax=Streptomyces sp. H39-S7 TaxID=3004357 RepID=UPI0022AEB501|nr:GNAT family N-acetyltransferase [Streptomyces sp. H39-S7]MCZ4123553.1 GNAT family N-acetyltransferase [Streptomyces sp. H39-S7]
MPTEFIRPAGAADVPALMALRAEAEEWLQTKGTDQWSDREAGARAIDRWHKTIDDGRAWLVVDGDGRALATVSRGPIDRDFWTDDDKPESAFYLYKLIVARAAAGRGLGVRIVDWASKVAALEGRDWVRIDTWRSNIGLQSYYEGLGFKHVRTESPPHRRSGWLAQRPASVVTAPNAPLAVGDSEDSKC